MEVVSVYTKRIKVGSLHVSNPQTSPHFPSSSANSFEKTFFFFMCALYPCQIANIIQCNAMLCLLLLKPWIDQFKHPRAHIYSSRYIYRLTKLTYRSSIRHKEYIINYCHKIYNDGLTLCHVIHIVWRSCVPSSK